MSDVPDRLNIDKKDRDLYNKLDQEEILRFKGGKRTRKEQFLLALSFGLKNNVSKPLNAKEGWFLTKDLNEEDKAILNSIALYNTKSVEVLNRKSEVFKIAEEYAHAGIRLLFDLMNSVQFGSFNKRLELDVINNFNKLSLNDVNE